MPKIENILVFFDFSRIFLPAHHLAVTLQRIQLKGAPSPKLSALISKLSTQNCQLKPIILNYQLNREMRRWRQKKKNEENEFPKCIKCVQPNTLLLSLLVSWNWQNPFYCE